MIIEDYGIKLVRLNRQYLEIVRNWRNSNYVREQMIYSDYITEQMQIEWFVKINNDQNYYFVAEFENEPFALIHLKNIHENCGEGGIFLAHEKFENTGLLPRVVLAFNDFIFDELHMEYVYVHIKKSNKKAISLSLAEGFIEVKEKSTDDVLYLELREINYLQKTNKLRKILKNG